MEKKLEIKGVKKVLKEAEVEKKMEDVVSDLGTVQPEVAQPEVSGTTIEVIGAQGEIAEVPSEAVPVEGEKENLEPTIKAPDPEKPEEVQDFKSDEERVKAIAESFSSIFSILKSKNLSEELGDAAAEPVATTDAEPKAISPEVTKDEVHPGEQAAEEVKEVIVESGDPEYQAKFKALLAKYGVKSQAELSDEKKKEFFKEVDAMHVSKEEKGEKKEVVQEAKKAVVAPKAAAPVAAKKEAPKAEEKKLPFPGAKPFAKKTLKEDEEKVEVEIEDGKVEVEVPAEEKPVEAAPEAVEVSVTAEPVVKVSDEAIHIEIPAAPAGAEAPVASEKEAEALKEAFRTVYSVLKHKPLLEEESVEAPAGETVEVPADAEAEVKVEEDKIVVHIPTAEAPESIVTPAEAEELKEAVKYIGRFFSTRRLSEQESPVMNHLEKKPATISKEADVHSPELSNKDILKGQHAEDVKEVIVEAEELGSAAAEPIHDEKEAKEHTPAITNKDILVGQHAEEVKEVIVEQNLNEGTGLVTFLLTLLPGIGPVIGGLYASSQVKKVVSNSLNTKPAFRKKAEELKMLENKSKKTPEEKDRMKYLKDSIKSEIKEAIKGKVVNMKESEEVETPAVPAAAEEPVVPAEEKLPEEEPAEEAPAAVEVSAEVEPVVKVSDEAIHIEIPAAPAAEAPAPSAEEAEELKEAFRTVFSILKHKPLLEEESVEAPAGETVEVPADAQAEVKVEEDKIVVHIPTAEAPEATVTPVEAEELKEAVKTIGKILSTRSLKEFDESPAMNHAKKNPPTSKKSADVESPELSNKDILVGQHAEDVKEVIVEAEELGSAAAEPVHDEKEAKEHTPAITNKDILVGQHAEEVKEVIVEAESPEHKYEGKKAIAKGEDVVTVNFSNSDRLKGKYGPDVEPALMESEGGPISGAEVTKAEAEAVKPVEVLDAKGDVVKVAQVAHTEVKSGEIKVAAHDHASKEGAQVRDALHETHHKDEAEPRTAEEIAKGTHPVHTEVKDGEVKVVAHDLADAEGVEVRKEIVKEQELGSAAAEPVATTDAAPKAISPEVSKDEVHPDEQAAEEVKEVIIESEYGSLKELFLLEGDYFAKPSLKRVTPEVKVSRLEEQLSLLIARDAADPLYEELLKTTIIAKRLQEQLQHKYKKASKEKAKSIVEMKSKKKAAPAPVAPAKEAPKAAAPVKAAVKK
jgi:hypothetical protein